MEGDNKKLSQKQDFFGDNAKRLKVSYFGLRYFMFAL